jgi:hypothetical protein
MLDLYALLIAQIQNRSVQLAVKLKHAKLTQFTKQKLVFSDCPENKLFAQLSESEAEIFLTAMAAIGCTQCQIEGLELPSKVVRQRQAAAAEVGMGSAALTKSAPTGERTAPLGSGLIDARPAGKALEAIANLSKEDPFAVKINKAGDQKKNEQDSELSRTPEGISLASVEQAEEARRWKARQAEVRAKPILKKLEALGADIEVLPLKNNER